MKVFLFIRDLFRRYPRQFSVALALMLMLNIFEMATAVVLVPMIDLMTRSDIKTASAITLRLIDFLKMLNIQASLFTIMGLFLVFAILKAVFAILVQWALIRMKYAVVMDVTCDTYRSFFKAGWPFFVSNSQGVLGNTFIKETSKVGDSFGNMGLIFVKIFQVFFYFLIAFLVSWKLSLLVFFICAILAIPFSLMGRVTYRLGKITLQTANRVFEIILENLSAAKTILGFGQQEKGALQLEDSLSAHIDSAINSQVVDVSTTIGFQPVGILILIISVILSQTLIKVPLSEMTLILFSFYTAIPMIGQIVSTKNILLNFFPSYEQLTELNNKALGHTQPTGSVMFEGIREGIFVKGLSFSYPGHEPVLKGINLEIPKGRMIAFAGKSGVGKSTLVDLILGFYGNYSGNIKIDDVEIKDINIDSWRKKLGYVPQDSILFNATIKENLKWAKEDASDDEIAKACDTANVTEFLDSLPQGLDSIVGDRGVRLSGGQRQRIALARAILRNPELFVLDEATSSLDSHSEKLIQEAIENISKQTTVIVIAHRLSTIEKADYIYVLDGGRIVEEGTFSGLCALKGVYYDAAKIQGLIN